MGEVILGRRPSSGAFFVVALALMMATSPLSIDMYLPAMPVMREAFGASEAQIQLSLSTFLIGMGLGQLFWGPLGDRLGRKRPLLVALAIYAVASIGCAMSGSTIVLTIWRFVQALAASAAPVMASAMIRDGYAREEGARLRSLAGVMSAGAPLVAPLIGAEILAIANWQAIFFTLAAFTLISGTAVCLLPETLPHHARKRQKIADIARTMGGLLIERRFMSYALASGFTFGALFAYISSTPFVYIAYFHVSPRTFALLLGMNVVGVMVSGLFNRHFVGRIGVDRMLRRAQIIQVAAVSVCFVDVFTGFGGLAGIVAPLFALVLTIGLISGNALSGATAHLPRNAGTAAALVGTLGTFMGALAGVATGWFSDGSPRGMAVIMMICAWSGLIVCRTLMSRR